MRALLLALGMLVPLIGGAEPLAITFDDLPLNAQLAPGTTRVGIAKDVLRILKQHHVAPTYGFINASKLEGNADAAAALQLWVAGKQRVGNHAYSHMDLHKSTAEAFMRDVAQNEPVLQLLAPGDEARWFRYPFLREGDTLEKRRAVRAQLQERGYRIAQVTLDYEDYLWNSAYARCAARQDAAGIAHLRSSYLSIADQYLDADREMARMVFDREISHVLLLHLGAFSSTILPDLLDLLRRKGFTFVTLEQAQSDPVYATDPDAASQHGGTLLEQWLDARKLAYPPVANKPYQELSAICGDTR